jgi:hypothetical protein
MLTNFCRGPAKGYIEGLEHRLHEAETLLLQLLPLVTPDQLSTATNLVISNNEAMDSPDHYGSRSSPPVLNKKTGIEYWENFPLDTVENVRRWQQDCALHSQFRDHDIAVGLNGPRSRPASRPASVEMTRETVPPNIAGNLGANLALSRKAGSMSQTSASQFRSMSTDPYAQQTQPGYMSPAAPTSTQQNWPANQNYMQSWQSGMGVSSSQHSHQQQRPQHQQSMVAVGGPMEIDGSFFTNDVKRQLFW